MRCGALGAVLVGVAVVQVAADVAAGNLQLRAHQRDHDVREVLAHAGLGGEGVFDGRVGLGGLRFVVEVFVELGVQLVQGAEGIAVAAQAQMFAEVLELGSEACEFAGQQHLPEVALVDQAVELVPRAGRQRLRHLVMRGHLDQRLRHDDELAVQAGDVEVMHVIREMVAIAEDAAAGADGEVKGQAALLHIGARVHARLHDAFAHRGLVEKLRQMADRVIHRYLQFSSWSLHTASAWCTQLKGQRKSHPRCQRSCWCQTIAGRSVDRMRGHQQLQPELMGVRHAQQELARCTLRELRHEKDAERRLADPRP